MLLGRQANMRIVLEHPARQVPGDGLDYMIRLPGFEQSRHDSMPQVMEPEALQARGVAQRAPRGVPLAGRLCRVKLVMLARAPEVVLRTCVSKFVRPLEHRLYGMQ